MFSRVTVCTQIALEVFSVGSERAPSHRGRVRCLTAALSSAPGRDRLVTSVAASPGARLELTAVGSAAPARGRTYNSLQEETSQMG